MLGSFAGSRHGSLTLHSLPGLTEEQIVEIFTAAGPVNSFRLVHDRETGRPKGYGFAEFPDQGMARKLRHLQVLTHLGDFQSRSHLQ